MPSLGTTFDAVLTHAAVAALLGAAAWSAMVLASLAAEAHTRGRVQLAERLGCPAVVRMWVLGIFLAMFAGIAPAQATDSGAGSATDTVLDGLPLPERAQGGGPHRHAHPAHRVVVHAGDSLWRIARGRLPAGASHAEIAALVASAYDANRAAIGPDPDRLDPGEHLDFPVPTIHPEAP